VARKAALVGAVPTPVVPARATRARRLTTRKERVSHRGLFLTREEMAAVAAAAATARDRLLVRALAETGARLGEVLALTPARLGPGYVVLPIEKRRQYEEKAVYLNPRSSLLHDLLRYAVEHGLARDARYWPISRQQGHTLVTRAAAAAGVYRLKPSKRAGVLTEVRTPAWPHLFRHGAATAMLEDSDDDAVFVRDQLGHRNIRETLQYAALSEAKRREKAARLRIAPETWPARGERER
jgi:integrase